MNLKVHLLLQIILIAIICFIATGAYVLVQANRQEKQDAAFTLDALGKYLEVQLLRIDVDIQEPGNFPDFDLWKQTHPASAVCLRYASIQRTSYYGLCQGAGLPGKRWPGLFETLYRRVFNPGVELTRTLTYNGKNFGTITVIPSVEMELAIAWDKITSLAGLAASTILAVCLLVYFAIQRALRPAQTIINSLEKMQHGDSAFHLPAFKLLEWQRIGMAINDFASTQKRLLSERKKLTLKLMSVQEEERRILARELHDELGQCLAAINALSASIIQTAQQDCPHVVPEAENIGRVNHRIMRTVRTLLLRLRPTELDELGLEACLNTMVEEWNRQHADQIFCRMTIKGECQSLSSPLPITLFRIVQEGLTNIVKHAKATKAIVKLEIAEQQIILTIGDNGKQGNFSDWKNQGIGLLGIRERVTGLGGQLYLNEGKSEGFILCVTLPKHKNGVLKT